MKESPERMRGMLKREPSSESRHQNRSSSRTSHEHKHRRSGTLASLAIVATSAAQTVYEDALDGLSGDEADVEEGDTPEALGAQGEWDLLLSSLMIQSDGSFARRRAREVIDLYPSIKAAGYDSRSTFENNLGKRESPPFLHSPTLNFAYALSKPFYDWVCFLE